MTIPKEVAAIREALEAGPTPGEWSVPHFARDDVRCDCGYVFSEFQQSMGSICEVNHGNEGDEPLEIAKANARLIAACNPAAMTAVLAHIDALTAERDAALARVGAAEADSKRLDWLETKGTAQFHLTPIQHPAMRWFDADTKGSDYSPTLRAAIDAAAAATKGSEA